MLAPAVEPSYFSSGSLPYCRRRARSFSFERPTAKKRSHGTEGTGDTESLFPYGAEPEARGRGEPGQILGTAGVSLSRVCAEPATKVESWSDTTHFVLSDVVWCDHGSSSSCSRCCGRSAVDVPVAAYCCYRRALPSSLQDPGSPELSFPAFAALLRGLRSLAARSSIAQGRLLDLACGQGCASIAWLLLLPDACAEAVEPDLSRRAQASNAVATLPDTVLRRLQLHGHELSSISLERADVVLLRPSRMPQDSLALLGGVSLGTFIVSLGAPLPDNFSAGVRLVLAWQAEYRTALGSNTIVYVYTTCS